MNELAERKAAPGLVGRLTPFLAVVVLCGGMGAGYRLMIDSVESPKPKPDAVSPPKAEFVYHAMPPVITNIGNPTSVWIRLDLTLKMAGEMPMSDIEKESSRFAEDALAYARTLSVSDVEGATGLLHLRQDLGERASVRSNGKIKEVIIRSMVLQ
ncbi:MAG: flagellar basal body-associated protein FliL [Beijerinckiaceae bacterium]